MFADIETTHPTVGQGLTAIDVDTLRNTGIVCAILIALGLAVRLRMSADHPRRVQTILESVIDFINELVRDALGTKPINLGPIAISLFLFILISNWIGLVPGFKSPTNDVNTTFALALFSIALLHFYSIKFRGMGGYVSHYFSSAVTPSWRNPLGALARIFFALLELIQELARPVTLSFRLYFNIFAGELVLALIILLLSYAAVIVGPVWVLFSLFVGVIQAFIFTMLTISYIAMGTDVVHGEEKHHAAPAA